MCWEENREVEKKMNEDEMKLRLIEEKCIKTIYDNHTYIGGENVITKVIACLDSIQFSPNYIEALQAFQTHIYML